MANRYELLYGKSLKNISIPTQKAVSQANSMTDTNPGKKKSKRDKSQTDSFIIDHQVIYGFFRTDPLINACASVTTDNVCSDGFETYMKEDSPEAEKQKEVWEHFMLMNNWMSQMRNVTMGLVVFDDAFQEVRNEEGGDQPAATNVLDTTQMKVEQDESGSPKGYGQYIKGKKVTDFSLSEVIHYKLNIFGDSQYGLSLIEPVLYTAAAKRFAEMYSAKYFQNQKPRGAWIFPETIDDDDYDDNVDMIIEAKNQSQKDLFLRGTGIDFKSFTGSEDMEFVNYLKYLREQIVTSMLVPPIMLGIPEGSNKSNSDVQIKAFDRRIRAIQQAIEYKINMHLIKFGFGFDKIEFRFKRVNKAEELRDMEIVQKYEGIATLNEVREMAELPELEDEEAGEEIWRKSSGGFGGTSFDFNSDRDTTQEKGIKGHFKPHPISHIKATKKPTTEKAPPQNPIKEKDENQMALTIIDWVKDVRRAIKEDLASDLNFTKAIQDPAEMIQKILAYITVSNIRQQLQDHIQYGYTKGVESVGKELGFTFTIDQDELDFIQKYTFDLVKGLNDDMEGKLKQVLQRGVIDGKGMNQIQKDIAEVMDLQMNRAETIARTEMQRAGNYGRLNAYQEAGVGKIQWLAIIDDRTSEICKKLNGQTVKPGNLFKTTVNGKNIQVKAPPAHPNCRSTIVALDEVLP
jgi:SPP1 gp7 family putative phage head morphogenesis protein